MIAALSPFVALAVCSAPLAVAVGSRFGARLGLTAALVANALLVLVAFLVARVVQLDPLWVTLGLGILLAVGTALPAKRAWHGLPSRTTRAALSCSLVGGIVWFAALSLARVLPHGAPLSWSMAGDSANQVHLLRGIIEDSGLSLTSGNPVPLPSILLALGAIPGRGGMADPALLGHDISALATVWSLGIALTAVMLGLVVSSLVTRHRPVIAGLAAAAGSALALSWYVLGLPIDSGYLNVHIALPFVLATWIVLLESRRSPAVAVSVLLALSIILFATWSPLVLFSIGALAVVLVREVGVLRRLSTTASVVLLVTTLAFVFWLLVVTVPNLRFQKSALAAGGHGFPATIGILAAVLAIAMALAVLLRRAEPGLRVAVLVLVGSSAIGYAGHLYFAQGIDDPFNAYYVAKFSWLATILVGAVALALLVRWSADRLGSPSTAPRRTIVVTAGLGVLAITLASLGPMPMRQYDAVPVPPLARVLDSTALGDAPWSTGDRVVDLVLSAVDAEHPGVYWDTAEPDEAYANFWVLLFEGGQIGASDPVLRNFPFAFYRQLRDTGASTLPELAQLCSVLDALGDAPVVYTGDKGLSAKLSAECPLVSARATIREVG